MRSPHHVVADVDGRGLDLHALHAGAAGAAPPRWPLSRARLPLSAPAESRWSRSADRFPPFAAAAAPPAAAARRSRWPASADRRASSRRDPTSARSTSAAPSGARHVPPRQPGDHRFERVADEHGQHDGMIIAWAYCSTSTMASPASTVSAALRMSTGIRSASGSPDGGRPSDSGLPSAGRPASGVSTAGPPATTRSTAGESATAFRLTASVPRVAAPC